MARFTTSSRFARRCPSRKQTGSYWSRCWTESSPRSSGVYQSTKVILDEGPDAEKEASRRDGVHVVRETVAVAAEDGTLGDLALDSRDRAVILHHLADGEVFLLSVGVMKLERPVVAEAALSTAERLLDLLQPGAEGLPATVL